MSPIFYSTSPNSAKKLANKAKQGKLRRIYHGIYTDNFNDSMEMIVNKHWMQIVSHIVSNGVLSFRTAVDLKPTPYQNTHRIVFLTSSYIKTIHLPGLVIKVYKGNTKNYCEQVLPSIARSNVPRMLLENLTAVKKPTLKNIKTIGRDGVEKFLARELQFRGEQWLNQIREQAKQIALDLHYQREYKSLTQMISALLATQDVTVLNTCYAKATAMKEPYDENRLQAFENLSIFLQKCLWRARNYSFSLTNFRNLSFFESYFSNFIEGTEFIIDEAENIVFTGHEIAQRHADSHDILANFYLANDYLQMSTTPQNATEFLQILKSRHSFLMKERPEKFPGDFKNKANKAGNTYFVEPKNVIGTLTRGFEIYALLQNALAKALFMHYLVSEVHPFNDGNGRLARIMMNAELVKANLIKIIIPTVYRDNYLAGLRLASRDQNFHTYCKVMDLAQAYTQSINWTIYTEARAKIEADHANFTADEGLPIFNRALRHLILSDIG